MKPASSAECYDIARATFDRIRDAYPHLEMMLDLESSQVDMSLDIPQQQGLRFDLSLSLQNGDELCISAGRGFFLSYFPCTSPDVVDAYAASVFGLLSGTARIVEHRIGNHVYKAHLQSWRDANEWESCGTWSTFPLWWPRPSVRVLHNEDP